MHEVWVGVIFHDPLALFDTSFLKRRCCPHAFGSQENRRVYFAIPIASMGLVYLPRFTIRIQLNVGKSIIHGWYGMGGGFKYSFIFIQPPSLGK